MEAAPSISSEKAPATAMAALHLHQDDADEEDDNVKQLNECSAIYLSLQASFLIFFFFV